MATGLTLIANGIVVIVLVPTLIATEAGQENVRFSGGGFRAVTRGRKHQKRAKLEPL
jgi:hypothetical protein